jgi:outer membrane lipoprotein SlyB
MKKLTIIIAIAIAATGCANTGANYRPIVDRPGSDYEQNLAECQQHAQKLSGAAGNAAAGAVAGAIFGALVMSAMGVKGYRNEGAMVGALNAGATGAISGETSQRQVIKNCLAGRGFSVLH